VQVHRRPGNEELRLVVGAPTAIPHSGAAADHSMSEAVAILDVVDNTAAVRTSGICHECGVGKIGALSERGGQRSRKAAMQWPWLYSLPILALPAPTSSTGVKESD